MRLTSAQALLRFLAAQSTERDGQRQQMFAGCFGIMGHGNLAGLGQAMLETPDLLPFYPAHNEQGMVHAAVGYARMSNRLRMFACTSSIGPGATNMVTGAALATTNHLPVLLLPGDIIAERISYPLLQELEDERFDLASVNQSLQPVSRYFQQVWRPEQLIPAMLHAMRVLSDPADTGAVTLALPQDVQVQAHDWPDELFAPRTWRVPRARPDEVSLTEAAALLRGSARPLVVAGGGVIYSSATRQLAQLAEASGVPVAMTQAGLSALPAGHPQSLGAIGATGTAAANSIARDADLVIGIGTRWTDFTTASGSLFGGGDVRFVNVNVKAFDAMKLSGHAVVGDARVVLDGLSAGLEGWRVGTDYIADYQSQKDQWMSVARAALQSCHRPLPSQSEVIGVVNRAMGERDVVVAAAGSLPGDLHKLWSVGEPATYHVEYAFSCMGYEIPAGIGVKLAAPDRRVVVMVGDASYLMLPSEIVTAVQHGVVLTIVVVQNHGYASIGALSATVGAERFGTERRQRGPGLESGGPTVVVDIAANAASLGALVEDVATIDDLTAALERAGAATRTTVIVIETDPSIAAPSSQAWWEVPVAEVSARTTTQAARCDYVAAKTAQRTYLSPPATGTTPEPRT